MKDQNRNDGLRRYVSFAILITPENLEKPATKFLRKIALIAAQGAAGAHPHQ
jgi:hypothetical protein